MNPATIYNIIALCGLVLPMLGGLFAFLRHLDKKVDAFDHAQIRLQDHLESMDTQVTKDLDALKQQFGPNGGGLRQAVNEMSRKIDTIERRTNHLVADVAELSGKFEQHVIEGVRAK